MPLKVDADKVSFQLLFELFSNFAQQASPLVLLTFALEVFPLSTFLDLNEIDGQEVDAVAFQLPCIMRMSHQVEVHDVLRFHKLTKDILTKISEAGNHEVVSVNEQSQEESQVALCLTEIISVEELDYGCEVLLWNSSHDHVAYATVPYFVRKS